MKYQLRFGGEGGQGVITAGEILAEAAIKEGRQAFKASTYTSQVRGGPTKVD
ncbi:2-oxoacid:acceptor oxidoreductase family protein, partial [Campylobacter coli]